MNIIYLLLALIAVISSTGMSGTSMPHKDEAKIAVQEYQHIEEQEEHVYTYESFEEYVVYDESSVGDDGGEIDISKW